MWFKRGHAPSRRVEVIAAANMQTAKFETQMAELEAAKPALEASRAEAKRLRDESVSQLRQNHFGQAIELAMHRRGA